MRATGALEGGAREDAGGDRAALDRALAEHRTWFEEALARFVLAEEPRPASAGVGECGDVPPRLRSAMRYALRAGGKRLRPILCRWVTETLGGTPADCERAAVAIECVHTYSLVHDDLPAMDDDDLRRGRPTCHVAFDEATAILVGDGLQARAFELLAGDPRGRELVAVLAAAAGPRGMVGGQALDLRPVDRGPGLEGLLDVHARKTAALFGAAAEMGALCAGGSTSEREAARAYGASVGLAFQTTDDVLDVTGDAESLGKTPGKDAALERQSAVDWLGLDGARALARDQAERAREAARRLGAGPSSPLVALPGALLERTG